MNRIPQTPAISLRTAPTDRTPTKHVMSNAMQTTSTADTMSDIARRQVGDGSFGSPNFGPSMQPDMRGHGAPAVRPEARQSDNVFEAIFARLAQHDSEIAEIAELKERIAAIEAAAAPQTGEIDGA